MYIDGEGRREFMPFPKRLKHWRRIFHYKIDKKDY